MKQHQLEKSVEDYKKYELLVIASFRKFEQLIKQ